VGQSSITPVRKQQATVLQLKKTQQLMKRNESNQIKSNYFIVRLKVDQRAGQLSLPHLGITKTEK